MSPMKKRKLPKNPQGTDDQSESDNGNIEATFEGRNIEEFDFDGVKQLIQQVFAKAHIDFTQLTDLIIQQQGIGSVLKQVVDDDENSSVEDGDFNDVFGVTTVLNLSMNKDTPCIQEIFNYIKEQAKKNAPEDVYNKFSDLVDGTQLIGLILNERFLNIPAAVSAPMLTSLQQEINRMKKKNLSYDFQYYIMFCKTYKPKKVEGETSFSNEEESIFCSHADCSFEYTIGKELDTAMAGNWKSKNDEVILSRKVIFFSSEKLESIIPQITEYVRI